MWTALALMPVLLVYTASGVVLLLGLQNRFRANDTGLVQTLVVGVVQLHVAQLPAAPPLHTPSPHGGPGHALFLALSLLLCAAIILYSATGLALAWRGAWRRSSTWCVAAGSAAVILAIVLQLGWWHAG